MFISRFISFFHKIQAYGMFTQFLIIPLPLDSPFDIYLRASCFFSWTVSVVGIVLYPDDREEVELRRVASCIKKFNLILMT
ncbi:hypothetical protein M501DRAFT_203966 [Patellaria atrata CBS 101060]|uniref:Uncharacterized protein n=1 Tax=Patellaria atrata CBS 101060 TaxID=1346257 RepID=A0A9P4S968_9PEZI|nr:hypothetical protein M501DRAFT_203966 [Patellaria atrata CBS 101060]